MDIASATSAQAAQPASATPPAAPSDASDISSDFETFLKMLTVQMQNQDPLDPVKSEDFSVQLATFSGVEQQVQTNDLLKSLAEQMNVMGMAQLSGWVGMEALAPVAAQFDGAPITLSPSARPGAGTAVLVVSDANGNEVQRAQIPVSGASLEWTGILPDGSSLPPGAYSFAVESIADGAVFATDPVEVYTRIVEARIENGQTTLITEGGGSVAASAVSGLREPDPAI